MEDHFLSSVQIYVDLGSASISFKVVFLFQTCWAFWVMVSVFFEVSSMNEVEEKLRVGDLLNKVDNGD